MENLASQIAMVASAKLAAHPNWGQTQTRTRQACLLLAKEESKALTQATAQKAYPNRWV
jgi:hypothetical protein